jgi:hypothetical protein
MKLERKRQEDVRVSYFWRCQYMTGRTLPTERRRAIFGDTACGALRRHTALLKNWRSVGNGIIPRALYGGRDNPGTGVSYWDRAV